MSAPDMKALSPAPRRITTRTAASSRNSVSARPNPSHISIDMALRFSGLLKVTMPTPSMTFWRILPSAKDFWSVVGMSSMNQALGRGDGIIGNEALLDGAIKDVQKARADDREISIRCWPSAHFPKFASEVAAISCEL